jgi:multidrug efflux pump
LQLNGVGEVDIGGSSLPAVRVELNPRALFRYGIGLEDVRAAISAANANSPKGFLQDPAQHYQLYVNDTATSAAAYRPLIIAYRNNAPVRLSDVADVSDGVENIRNLGLVDGKAGIVVLIHKQPGANIINVVNSVKALLPQVQASIPSAIKISAVSDRSPTIRASLHDVEITLLISTLLVILVVYVALRNPRAALIPAVAVPVSLVGTFGAMYLLGYSLNLLSLMALTIATGFVVDDAIVMLENISRHREEGMPPMQAALQGAREVGFTVLAMSISLIAVFLPILMMGGIVGRTFREFAMTLSVSIVLSLLLSLTTTPMMCAYVLGQMRAKAGGLQDRFLAFVERGFNSMRAFYARTLRVALAHPALVMLVLLVTVILNVYLFAVIPKGFFPQEDTGQLMGMVRADQDTSFDAMSKRLRQVESVVQSDPGVAHVVGFTGGGGGGPGGGGENTANMFVDLKPLSERKISTDQVIARLRRKLSNLAGAQAFFFAQQDIRAGGRQSNSQYQYTLLSDDLDQLNTWAPKITEALKNNPALEDVSSDRQQNGLEVKLDIDRNTAARMGINPTQIDNTLYDAFGQRLVSTIYNEMNQYYVMMEVQPKFWRSPETLKDIWISTSGGALTGTQNSAAATKDFSIGANATSTLAGGGGAPSGTTGGAYRASTASGGTPTTGSSTVASSATSSSNATTLANSAASNARQNALANSGRGGASTGASLSTLSETMVPLSTIAHYGPSLTPSQVMHQGPFVATTISFNLPVGESLSQATLAINQTLQQLHVPIGVHGSFAGTAQLFQQTLSNEGLLILAAIGTVYIVLGMLYESFVHPITILSTLPSAGVGAVLALLIFNTEFSLVALIGVILLIGIVKKNAIIMIDVAIMTEREKGIDARAAIYQACLVRFRPIMMTTFAALFGALPLAVTTGNGAEFRQPLGTAIVGGLLLSQILTLYTTPVVYIYLDRFRLWIKSLLPSRRRTLVGPAQQHPA